MVKLEDLKPESWVKGIRGSEAVCLVSITPMGEVVQVFYRDSAGNLHDQLLFRSDEARLELVKTGRQWSFEGDGALFRLVSEAERIRLSYLFDPYVAVSSSTIDPLPHQISAVYEHMLPRQPMRFLLADDPGAGKTIMAGLLIKELLIRGELERCLIVAPGSLTEQWQDELQEKFELKFELLTREMINASGLGNPFADRSLLIARMDQLSRDESLQDLLLQAPEWDLAVFDESHRMSAQMFSGELKKTKRYSMGQRVGNHTRNLLLMTATPHNGKEEDFQAFMALLDEDRFEGQQRDGVHRCDPRDLMRRLVKEDLYTFEGKKLFPERRSYTAEYELTDLEKHLYEQVTEYVREEMNRADRLADQEGGNRRRVNVGFALMTLQRRLASSPYAIHRSIERRRERLEKRLKEERLQWQGREAGDRLRLDPLLANLSNEDIEDLYAEDPADEVEAQEEQFTDNATTAQTLLELANEIEILKDLERLSRRVVEQGSDAKWNELTRILDHELMKDSQGSRRKLVVFTEFKDTLTYLATRIRNRLGQPEAVVEIHGGVPRDRRRAIVSSFMNNPDVVVLLANDAAGEGVNLQRSHLMVNYDLPWNPNRLEQRFGRIHRIGQREVCHLWNLLAKDTREGDVYIQLLHKLERAREALGDKVFDVIGQLFSGISLRELLMQAVRYNEQPETKAQLERVIDGAVDQAHLQALIDERSLTQQSMDLSRLEAMRQQMDRAMARRIHPYYVQDFFLEAFQRLGGRIHRREKGRYEITHVSAAILDRDQYLSRGIPVQKRYERVCFEKAFMNQGVRAELISPGHPLLEAVISLTYERDGHVLPQGTILVDEQDLGVEPRMLFSLEHEVQDGRVNRHGQQQVISKRLQYLEISRNGAIAPVGPAPYLDYRPLLPEERPLLAPLLEDAWLAQNWNQVVFTAALQSLVPQHLEEVRSQRLALLAKVRQEVNSRMQREINHWFRRWQELKQQEAAGKSVRLPAYVAQERHHSLVDRLEKRNRQLDQEQEISSRSPMLKSGALIIPAGLLRLLQPTPTSQTEPDALARQRVEQLAMAAVFEAERSLGRTPRDVSAQRGLGYDIESVDAQGNLVFIEVKGRIVGADSVTLTVNEVNTGRNAPDRFRLALVIVEGDRAQPPIYVSGVDFGVPGFAETSKTYNLQKLVDTGRPPH